jgi:mono/diheme cytochrome c family protein
MRKNTRLAHRGSNRFAILLSVLFVCPVLLAGLAGCGSGVNDVLFQALSATGQTVFDMALTDAVNAFLDARDGEDEPPADDDATDGADDDGDADADGDDGGGDGEPDGAALYGTGCAACHAADGTGGAGPDITGLSAADLTDGLGSAIHGSITLTEDEVAAIAEFLGG